MNAEQLKKLEVANLEVDSKIGKDRHFIAADRKNLYKTLLGLTSVIGTALIASAAFKEALPFIDSSDAHQKLAFSALSVLVSLSTAVLGFFGLEKQVSQHRIVGNRYIEVARKARRLLNKMVEGLDGEEFEKQFNSLLLEYMEVNREGESCPTSNKDSKKSINLNSTARSKIKAQIKKSDNEALGISSIPSRQSLMNLTADSIRLKLAWLLNKMYVLSDTHYDLYVKQFE